MKTILPIIGLSCMFLAGCSTASQDLAQQYAQKAVAVATTTTSNGQPVDEVVAEQILALLGKSGPKTSAYTQIGTVLVNGTLAVATNLKSQGITDPGTIAAAQTTYLNSSSVQQAAVETVVPDASVVITPVATPVTQ